MSESAIFDSRRGDRVRIRQQQFGQPQYEKVKTKKHLQICGECNFTIPLTFYKSNSEL